MSGRKRQVPGQRVRPLPILWRAEYPPHALGVFPFEGPFGRKHNFRIGEKLRMADLATLDHFETMTRLGAGNPEDPAKAKIKEMVEIHVGFVKKDDLLSRVTMRFFSSAGPLNISSVCGFPG